VNVSARREARRERFDPSATAGDMIGQAAHPLPVNPRSGKQAGHSWLKFPLAAVDQVSWGA